MTMTKHEAAHKDLAVRGSDFVDRFFGDRRDFFRPRFLFWPDETNGVRVEEFREDGTLIVRAEMAGLDPDKDVEVTVTDGVLRIDAERREEDKTEERDYVRQEFRYGSYVREIPLPTGVTDKDVKATYKNGILEVKIPMPKSEPEATTKVPVTKG